METLMEHQYGFEYNDSFNYPYYDEVPCNNRYEAEYRHIAIPIILCIVIVLSLLGNILVVVISVFCRNIRSPTNIFIINLALSDLLFTVGLLVTVGLPFRVYYEYSWGWTFGDAMCKVIHFTLSAGFYSSMVFLVLMSIQRYMAVVHPLSRWKKGRYFTLVLVILWVVSVLGALPGSVHSVPISDSESLLLYCTSNSNTVFVAVSYEESIVFVCAFLVMAFCYIRILQTIFKSPTNRRHRTTGLAFFLVATFFICWAPYNIMNFLYVLIHHEIKFITQCEDLRLQYASYICQLLAFTRCCLNPVIYGLFGLKFHKTAREIFQRRATLNLAQMRMVDCHSDSCVN
ncbi:chemokine XC receptor 1 [Ictalurus punctatus]|uniref:Chemokine XC receptor 1 n=1 Tax=Ictalurus punctatus TaxID=7998 RepID=A0A2D0SHQ3_ICTPU|nr:chemokine XC receptor 1 [Ictalurus punctatus]